MPRKKSTSGAKKTIRCERCGKSTPLIHPRKRFCGEPCRKQEEKRRSRQRRKAAR